MKAQYTQLSFDFEFNQVSTVVEKENKCEVKQTVTARYSITKAEFEAQMALENDLINGRGAWLLSATAERAGTRAQSGKNDGGI